MFSFLLGIWDAAVFTPILNLVVFVYNLTPGPSFGWAIVGIAILIRFAFLYFTLKGYQDDLKLADVKPQIDKIQHDSRLSPKERIQKVSAITKPLGINPIMSAVPLFVQLLFLAVLYQILQVGLETSSLEKLYSFVKLPENVNYDFFGIDLTKTSLLISILATFVLFLERVWEYNEKKSQPLTSFSQKWDPVIWPLGSFVLLIILPSAKGIFVIASVAFSLVIKSIVHLTRGKQN